MILRWSALLSSLVIILCASDASAQEWIRDRRFDEGPGIRLGEALVLHPGLGIEGGYNTNYFYSHTNAAGTGELRVTAHLDLSTRSPQRDEDAEGNVEQRNVDFRFGVAAAYHEYLTSNEEIRDDRNVSVDANLNLHVLPGRSFSFALNDTFVRTVQPQNEVGPRNYNQDRNNAKIFFQYSPGGGMFELRVGYSFQFNYFEDDGNNGSLQYLGNYTAHEAFANIRWRFLPKTALIFMGSFKPILHEDGTPPSTDTGPTIRQTHDSYNVRGTVGLVGLLTRRFSIVVQAGYGAGFYLDGGQDYENFVGRLDLRFHVTPHARISVGYHRDFYDAIFSDWYSRDRVVAEYNHLIAGRVLLNLSAGFSYVSFSPVDIEGADPNRRDPMADAKLFIEYRIRDWIAINATARYLGNFTSYEYPFIDPEGDDGRDPGNFQEFVAMAGVRAMY